MTTRKEALDALTEIKNNVPSAICIGFEHEFSILEEYIRADLHQARVEELLKSNNELLERARKAEQQAQKESER